MFTRGRSWGVHSKTKAQGYKVSLRTEKATIKVANGF